MYRSREDARAALCPFAVTGILAGTDTAGESFCCEAEYCMMWRETREFEGRNVEPIGWCGLAGEPKY